MSEPSPKPSAFESRPTLLLANRLRDLGISVSGLPDHVVTQLRSIISEEAAAIQRELDAEIDAANKRAGERLSRRVASRLTFKSIGKSFGKLRGSVAKTERKSSQVSSTSVTGGAS